MAAIQQIMLAFKPAVPSVTYATWDPLNRGADVILSNGNLTAAFPTMKSVYSTIGKSAGKWQAEFKRAPGSTYACIGFANGSAPVSSHPYASSNAAVLTQGGSIASNGNYIASVGAYTSADTIGLVMDVGAQELRWYKNGTLIYVGSVTSWSYIYIFVGAEGNSLASGTLNCGQTPFDYPIAGANPGLYV